LVAAGLAVAPAASAETSAAPLARQILDERDRGKISIDDYSADPVRDRADRSLASQQLEDIAAGQPAHLSTRCSYAAQYPSNNTVPPDVRVLQFLADLGQQSTYKLNVLFGQCHKAGASSMHPTKEKPLIWAARSTPPPRILWEISTASSVTLRRAPPINIFTIQ
jgi:hypothetical protein